MGVLYRAVCRERSEWWEPDGNTKLDGWLRYFAPQLVLMMHGRWRGAAVELVSDNDDLFGDAEDTMTRVRLDQLDLALLKARPLER